MHKGKSRGGSKRGRPRGSSGAAAASIDAPFQKNEEVTVDIIGLTHDGEGVGRADGFTLFIQGALPGERVRAKVMKVKKQYGYARMEELLVSSPSRVEPLCSIHKECGGCQLQHFDYPAQLEWKRQHVVDNLVRIGKLAVAGEGSRGAGMDPNAGNAAGDDKGLRDGIIVHPTVGMDEPWRYRNKAAVPVGSSADGGELLAGFYARGSHRIIDMDECLIQHGHNDDVIRIVKRIGRELEVSPYDEASGRGVLRHVMARTGVVTGEIMVVLVTNGRKLPSADRWVERIREELPDVKSIVQNVNERNTNVIFGDETRVLWGSEVIYDELDGIRFAISARSFYQVNPAQTVALYRKAVEYAGLSGTEDVIDAYCGIGTISLFLARKAGRVYGVEIVQEAIEDAARNAKLNGIENATFEAGPAEVVIPRWREEGITADVIVVDPPRKGCDPALLDTILAMQPERVVYVSCNPSTLARDLRVLEDGGYRTIEVTPVDMFPWTTHVECVSQIVLQEKAGSR
ncbi:23S rRNA (uracil(1939)-C(5))-methyltransferase RlmD [Paenibacillus alkaliterrae]|uniref:23S rRNA (uracil(1939)-C(5))-methyltransferase RlmD n=1 Tax=Paenibacillus alkaliterrae TaxID=320909 RepID=UPI001F37DAC6|nr:23S rRNA (uracil(1939)-C(5))-methyltransferase RlmD [Paenibacillus alkaliterrae]MCF2941042.1 23S rRNA (uracil(1939)-C(5))-methyltransferase RlmD [Paenibacillus alkaliterrae]